MTNTSPDDDRDIEIIINILRDDLMIESISVEHEPNADDADRDIVHMLIAFRDDNRRDS